MKNQTQETPTLPVGKANKPLPKVQEECVYQKTKTVPFHSVSLNTDYAQLQALGKHNQENN